MAANAGGGWRRGPIPAIGTGQAVKNQRTGQENKTAKVSCLAVHCNLALDRFLGDQAPSVNPSLISVVLAPSVNMSRLSMARAPSVKVSRARVPSV